MPKPKKDQHLDWFDEHDPQEELPEVAPRIRHAPNVRPPRKRHPGHKPKKSPAALAVEVAAADETQPYTYKASRHEALWIDESLGPFHRLGYFDDILRIVKGGKEASVYQLKGNETTRTQYLAGKIYRPRMFRQLRNDALYRQGRVLLDSGGEVIHDERMGRAVEKKTEFGRKVMHTSWIEHEYLAMQKLYAAGADIPRPYALGGNAILMEYIGGDVIAAPALSTVSLEEAEARTLFERSLHNIELMLSLGLVHGDFSAYNILYWEGRIWVIDFPQIVRPEDNRNARDIFNRDVERICQYFETQGVESNPEALADGLWRSYIREGLGKSELAALDPEDPADRALFYDNVNE